MKEKLAKLIDLKSIATLMVLSVFCYLSITGQVDIQNFMTIVTMIVTFYFAHKSNKKEGE